MATDQLCVFYRLLIDLGEEWGEEQQAFIRFSKSHVGLPWEPDGEESTCNAGDMSSIPGLGRSPREGNGNPLQYSCLRTPLTEEPGRLQSTGPQRVGHD